MDKNRKIGLYFGSFNPIHNGHISVAESVVSKTDIDELWFVVSPQNPAKTKHGDLIDPEHRLEMTRLSVLGIPKTKVCDREFSMPQPSYTADTLKVLREEHPYTEFLIIAGTDVQVKLGKHWRNKEDIMNNHKLIVYPRDLPEKESSVDLSSKVHDISIYLDDMPKINISSTMIRQNILNGITNFGLIHNHVYDYIKKNNLYLS